MKRVEVLKLMAEGWELAVTTGTSLDSRVSIQKGGQGKGGESRTVSMTVFESMRRRGEIVANPAKDRFWRRKYMLATSSDSRREDQ